MPDRIFPRPKNQDPPTGTGADHESALQGRYQARSDQGRLPASRSARDLQKTRRAQTPQELVNLFFPAKEKMVLVRFKGTKPGERIEKGGGLHLTGIPLQVRPVIQRQIAAKDRGRSPQTEESPSLREFENALCPGFSEAPAKLRQGEPVWHGRSQNSSAVL